MSHRIELEEDLLGNVEDFREDGSALYQIESVGSVTYRVGSPVGDDDFKLAIEMLRVHGADRFTIVRDADPFTNVRVKVFSDGFYGKGDMKVLVKEIAKFAVDLKNLYETLKGSARLEEPYFPNNFIEFVVKKTGRVVVSGRIHDCYPRPRTLTFEDEIDQTYLRTFANELFADFGK